MAEQEIGRLVVNVGLDGTGFQNGISNLSRQMRIVQAEFESASARLGNFGNATERLRLKADSLTRQIEIQNQRVSALRAAYEQSVAAKGADAEATQALQIRLLRAQTQLSNLENQLERTNADILRQGSAWQAASDMAIEAGERLSKIGAKMSAIGRNLTTFVTLPILGIGAAATKLAMDSVESENLFETSMGNMAEAARKWSEDLSKSLGLNAFELRKNTGMLYTMFNSMKLGTQDAYNMSTGLTQLAYDMASFYNIKPEEAFEKLRAGITGETEPLKALGILVDEATVKTYAYSHGIAKQGAELTEQQKVLARYGAIMDQTKTAQGDLARTMDSPTNQMRVMQEQAKQAAIQLGISLIPMLQKLIAAIKPLIERFAGMNESQRETVVKVGLFVAAIGPAILTIGKLISAAGAIAEVFAPAAAAIAEAGGLIPALTAGLTALTGPVGIAILAIVGLTVAGIALYKHFKQDSIPTIDLFGKQVSESTKKAVGGFMDLNTNATKALDQLNWSGQAVTNETATKITSTFEKMGDQVKKGLDQKYKESLDVMQKFFASSSALSDKEEADALAKMAADNEKRKQTVQDGENKIKEIITKASQDKRAITDEERKQINDIQTEMVNTGIQVLSKNEVEAKIIMERMRQQAGEISARQAAEVVEQSNKQKNDAIKAANDQYDQVLAQIIKQRDETHTISKDQADKLIAEATRQRDETISKAQDMHNKVVDQAKKQAGEHANEVNWETGQILTKWEMFKQDVGTKWDEIKSGTINSVHDMKTSVVNKYEELKNQAHQKIEDLRAAIDEKIRAIKRAFDFELKFPAIKIPHIPLPHFTISGSFSLSPPSTPSFGVNWYAAGGIFNRPSIIGVGEAGTEVVTPIDKLYSMIQRAISERGTDNGYWSDRPIELIVKLDSKIISRELYIRSQDVRRGAGRK